MSRKLLLTLALSEGTTDARTTEIRQLLSDGVRELLREHVRAGNLAAGEVLTSGEMTSVQSADARPQRSKSFAGSREWQRRNEAGVAQVRKALDDVARGQAGVGEGDVDEGKAAQ